MNRCFLTLYYLYFADPLDFRKITGWEQKAKFTDALWIVTLGTIISAVFGYFFQGIVGSIILFLIFLDIVKHFFDCRWLKVHNNNVAAVILIIIVIIAIVHTLIGFDVGVLPFQQIFN